MKTITIFLMMLVLLPMAFASNNINIKARSIENSDSLIYITSNFQSVNSISVEGRVFITVPELGVASAKKTVSQFSSGTSTTVGNIMYGNYDNDFEYVKVSFKSNDGKYSKSRYIPKEFLFY